jgi:hypothetical protein
VLFSDVPFPLHPLLVTSCTDQTTMLIGIIVAAILSVPLDAGPAASQPTTKKSEPIQMIFWEKQSWESGGPSERLTLWADGRSEITVRQLGKPRKTRPGWSAREEKPWTVYTKASPYSAEKTRQKFAAAIAAGIGELRTFPPGYADGSGTLSGVSVDGKLTTTVIPMFLHEGQKDNKGSENHKRFLAVDAILGDFDINATER